MEKSNYNIITKKMAIVYSAHLGTNKENIGDVLSAKAIAILCGLPDAELVCLPDQIGFSANRPVVYGGGGMLRPHFSEKENKDYILRNGREHYAIYGVGINIDIKGDQFSKEDFHFLNRWLSSAQSVTVRDLASQDFVATNFNLPTKLAPCPTYSVLKMKSGLRQKNKYQLGIVPSFGHTETYAIYRNDTISLIRGLLKKIGIKNSIIICHDKQDYLASKELFKNTGLAIVRPTNFDEVYKAYNSCKSIFSMRAHGIIFAAAADRPCSYVPLNVKLNSLYSYHYKGDYRDIDFNVDYHVANLENSQYPLDLKTNFTL